MADDAVAPTVNDPKAPVRESPNFSFPIFQTVKTSQTQHGLRHGDHQRYRQYCTRRMRRTRAALKFTNEQGKGKDSYKQKVVTAETTCVSVRHLELVLMEAERAWSFAMQIKDQLTAETPRKRHHLIKRLVKASRCCEKLLQLCVAVADARTQLEAEAYCAWMGGNVLLEKDQHELAIAKFLHAKRVYEQLGKISDLHTAALCDERATQLAPSIRFCKYIIQRESGGEVDEAALEALQARAMVDSTLASKLEHVLSASQKGEAQHLDSVQWRGNSVAVSNDKFRVALASAERMMASAARNDAADVAAGEEDKDDDDDDERRQLQCFQRAFTGFDECKRLIKEDEAALHAAQVKSDKVGQQRDALAALREYVEYRKYLCFVARNLSMVHTFRDRLARQQAAKQGNSSSSSSGANPLRVKGKDKKKVKAIDLVGLFDRTVDVLESARGMGPGAQEEERVTARQRACEAGRVYYLAASYARARKHAQAHALYGRAAEVAQAAQQGKGLEDEKALSAMLGELVAGSEAGQSQAQTDALLSGGLTAALGAVSLAGDSSSSAQEASSSGLTLASRLDVFDAGNKSTQHDLVEFPPRLQAVPCKPMLFDLAHNEAAAYPDISKRAGKSKKKEAPAPEAKGFFKSWFG